MGNLFLKEALLDEDRHVDCALIADVKDLFIGYSSLGVKQLVFLSFPFGTDLTSTDAVKVVRHIQEFSFNCSEDSATNCYRLTLIESSGGLDPKYFSSHRLYTRYSRSPTH